MKFTKMSLVAALLIGSSAFAIENTKVSGNAKLFYSTEDADTHSLFNKDGASAQAAASLSMSTDLVEGVSVGTRVTVLSSLGLQNQLVSNIWEQVNGVSDTYIVNDLWLAKTIDKTTVKVGRMPLDTPLVFSEEWGVVDNTFETAVAINQDIPDTTLVAAYIGGHNSGGNDGFSTILGADGTNDTTFSQFYNGAYTIGAINNSWEPLTVQAWYYDATHAATAYWLQADFAMEGFLAGFQYSGLTMQDAKEGRVGAVMLGYEMKDTFTAKVSYSKVGIDHSAGGNLSGTGQSKLYTEAWWNYAKVTQKATESYNITVEAPVADLFDFGAYFTVADQSNGAGSNDTTDLTLSASKSFGALDTSLVYSNLVWNDDNDPSTTADAYNQLQVYLTLNF